MDDARSLTSRVLLSIVSLCTAPPPSFWGLRMAITWVALGHALQVPVVELVPIDCPVGAGLEVGEALRSD